MQGTTKQYTGNTAADSLSRRDFATVTMLSPYYRNSTALTMELIGPRA